jgi:hypothetical protein
MTTIDPPVEAQIRRIMTLIDLAWEDGDRKSGPTTLRAEEYARHHPKATTEQIMSAAGCSKTTAQLAKQQIGQRRKG